MRTLHIGEPPVTHQFYRIYQLSTGEWVVCLAGRQGLGTRYFTPAVSILLDQETGDVYGVIGKVDSLPVVTMNDTDSILEATTEHLLKGK